MMDRKYGGQGRENGGLLKKVGPTKKTEIYDLPAGIKGRVRHRMRDQLFEL